MPLVKHLNSKHWYMAFMVDGKRYFRSTKTANKALAKKLEDAERNKIVEKNRLGLADEAITLKDALDSFIKSRA